MGTVGCYHLTQTIFRTGLLPQAIWQYLYSTMIAYSKTLFSGLCTGLLVTTFQAYAGAANTVMEKPGISTHQSYSDTNIDGRDSGVVAPGATPVKVGDGFTFTEGPAVDRYGNVFFTDQPNDKIWKYDTQGKLSLFMDKTGRSNGMYFDKKGNLITCADEHNEIWSISPDKKVTVLMKTYKGHRLNGPNDLWVDKKGGIYMTDPYYQRPYWDRKASELEGEYVYYLPKGAAEPVVVVTDLVKPNGIIGTPDGRYLYIADIGGNKTYRYQLSKNGRLADKQLVVPQGSDGMTLDSKGNIYVTGNGVTVYNKAGKQIDHIDIPGKWTANVCFAGKNLDQLFITATDAVYTVPMRVKGVR